ncbi:MAG: sigma-70 family RNA polymerase sigma factor [Acidobacteriaceae bacterium]
MLHAHLTIAPNILPMYSGEAPLALPTPGLDLNSRAIFSLPATPQENGNLADRQMMQQLRRHEPEALSRMYDLYSTLVYSIAMRVLRESAAAEDVMQEVFLKIWQHPESFTDHRGSLCGWLAVVTRNRAIDRIRGGRQFENVDDLQLSNHFDLGAEAEREIMLGRVRTVLAKMPEDQRQAMEMAFFEGHTHTEIAAQTGQPLGTIKTRIRTALTTIRKALEVQA